MANQNGVYLYNGRSLGYRNEVLVLATTWMNLEHFRQNERSQTSLDILNNSIYVTKPYKWKVDMWLLQGLRKREW